MALGSGLAATRATSCNASVSYTAKSTWITDTEGFRSVRACRKSLGPAGTRLVSTGRRMRRREISVNKSCGVRDIHPRIGQLRGPSVAVGPNSPDGSHVPLGQRGKGLQAAPLWKKESLDMKGNQNGALEPPLDPRCNRLERWNPCSNLHWNLYRGGSSAGTPAGTSLEPVLVVFGLF